MSKEELSQFGEEKEALFRDIYKNDIKPVDGLGAFLEQLKVNGIPAAIGTSAPRSNVDFVLAKTNFGKYFTTALDESSVTQGKPNPEIYQKVAAALNFPPEQCVVFEDSLSGVEAAQRAGCKVVGITTTHTSQELSHTNFNIPDFKNLEVSRLESLF
jgi:HAD superfamily hydrolase (TIGR01509 family)